MEIEKLQKSLKTLVLSDIHLNFIRAQRVIDSVPHDKLVLTGDYFDAYGATVTQTENTAIWLKEKILHNPKCVALLGNHDTTYVFNDINLACSGYSPSYQEAVNKIFNDDDRSKFGVYHVDQGFALSHAGLTNQLWKKYSSKFEKGVDETTLQFFDRVMTHYAGEAINDGKQGKFVELFAAGWDRGGFNRDGGINWVDWDNLSPINGVNQIVGHSIRRIPQILIQYKGGGYVKQNITEFYKKNRSTPTLSISYNLDTQLNHYAIIDNGAIDIFHINTGINLKNIEDYNIPETELNGLS
jgi:hypothetical protein